MCWWKGGVNRVDRRLPHVFKLKQPLNSNLAMHHVAPALQSGGREGGDFGGGVDGGDRRPYQTLWLKKRLKRGSGVRHAGWSSCSSIWVANAEGAPGAGGGWRGLPAGCGVAGMTWPCSRTGPSMVDWS